MGTYKNNNKRTTFIIFLSIIFLPLGYFAAFFFQIHDGPVNSFKLKYSIENRKKRCPWSAEKTYLHCIRKDYYLALRNTGPYQGQVAFQFESDLFRYDRDLQTSDRGKVNVYLDHIDLGINFLLIEKEFRMTRTNLSIPSILLAKKNRSVILLEISNFNKYFLKLESRFKKTIDSDQIIKARYQRLKKSFSQIRPLLL